MKKLDEAFYQRDDVVQISKDLLGKVLVTNIELLVSFGPVQGR